MDRQRVSLLGWISPILFLMAILALTGFLSRLWESAAQGSETPTSHEILVEAAGFNPEALRIELGDSITVRNMQAVSVMLTFTNRFEVYIPLISEDSGGSLESGPTPASQPELFLEISLASGESTVYTPPTAGVLQIKNADDPGQTIEVLVQVPASDVDPTVTSTTFATATDLPLLTPTVSPTFTMTPYETVTRPPWPTTTPTPFDINVCQVRIEDFLVDGDTLIAVGGDVGTVVNIIDETTGQIIGSGTLGPDSDNLSLCQGYADIAVDPALVTGHTIRVQDVAIEPNRRSAVVYPETPTLTPTVTLTPPPSVTPKH